MSLEELVKEAVLEVLGEDGENRLALKGIFIDSLAKFDDNSDVSILEFELNLKNDIEYNRIKNELRIKYAEMFSCLKS